MNDPLGPQVEPALTAAPSKHGHAVHRSALGDIWSCPACGAIGNRFIRSTGRWHRELSGESTFGYVTFCAACGHEHGEMATD